MLVATSAPFVPDVAVVPNNSALARRTCARSARCADRPPIGRQVMRHPRVDDTLRSSAAGPGTYIDDEGY
jgi:hypothetical protein